MKSEESGSDNENVSQDLGSGNNLSEDFVSEDIADNELDSKKLDEHGKLKAYRSRDKLHAPIIKFKTSGKRFAQETPKHPSASANARKPREKENVVVAAPVR